MLQNDRRVDITWRVFDVVWILAGPFVWYLRDGLLFEGSTQQIDSYVYLGFANDFGGLTERFGNTYYSTRVSAIGPACLFSHLAPSI